MLFDPNLRAGRWRDEFMRDVAIVAIEGVVDAALVADADQVLAVRGPQVGRPADVDVLAPCALGRI